MEKPITGYRELLNWILLEMRENRFQPGQKIYSENELKKNSGSAGRLSDGRLTSWKKRALFTRSAEAEHISAIAGRCIYPEKCGWL